MAALVTQIITTIIIMVGISNHSAQDNHCSPHEEKRKEKEKEPSAKAVWTALQSLITLVSSHFNGCFSGVSVKRAEIAGHP